MLTATLRSLTFSLFFFTYTFSYCQSQDLYTFPETIPDKYSFNSLEEYKYASKIKVRGATLIDIQNYAELVSYGKTNLFESGNIYMGWNEAENYLNEILNLELPDSLKNKHCKIYLVRDPYYNAFAYHDGSFFINIGLLADVYNEAGLAIIVGHEISHYLNNDVQKLYFEKLESFSKKNRNDSELKIQNAHSSQTQEQIADSVSFILSQKAGYDIEYGLNNFYHFLINEIISEDKKSSKSFKTVGSKIDSNMSVTDNLLSTHPKAQKRIDFLKNILKSKQDYKGGVSFQVNETMFYQLQTKARYEVLSLLLKDNDYLQCSERAFEYYLLEPNNDTYIYYLLESIRRMLYMEEEAKDRGFLTDNYRRFFNKGEGVLNNLHFLIRDSLKYSEIKAIELLNAEDIPFNTYSEAFDYFKQIAISKNIKESFLTLAIKTKDNKYRKEYLNKYLSMSGVRYKEYAKSLLSNDLVATIKKNDKKLFFVHDITFIEDHFYGYHLNLTKRDENSESYYKGIKKMFKTNFPDRITFFSKSIRSNNFNSYLKSIDVTRTLSYFYENIDIIGTEDNKEVVYFNDDDNASEEVYFDDDRNNASETDYEEGKTEKVLPKEDDKELFLLEPEIWTYYMDNNASSFEFIEVASFDDHTAFIKTVGNTLILPLIILFGGVMVGGQFGSNRYIYNIDYCRYNIEEKAPVYIEKEVHYKMKKMYLNNSIYHILHEKNDYE